MKNNIKRYKAGDFTSGKMGEIFRNSFIGHTTIGHKQYGDIYMINSESIKSDALFIIYNFIEFHDHCLETYKESNNEIYKESDNYKELGLSVIDGWFCELIEHEKLIVVKGFFEEGNSEQLKNLYNERGFTWIDALSNAMYKVVMDAYPIK